jgi:hypothetical protein
MPTAAAVDVANAAVCKWQERGYKVAVFRDDGAPPVDADLLIKGVYASYPAAIQDLHLWIAGKVPDVQVIVAGADDLLPDPKYEPGQLEVQFVEHFRGTFGVMQPTGDKYAGWRDNAISPWLGLDWCKRINGGKGPYWCGYHHLYSDRELCTVATKLDVYWMNPAVTQLHEHWTRGYPDRLLWAARQRIKDREAADKALYYRREREGFPGSEPLPE